MDIKSKTRKFLTILPSTTRLQYLYSHLCPWLPTSPNSPKLIQTIIPQLEKLPEQLLAPPRMADRIMIHRVRDEVLAALDLLRRRHG